MDVNEHERLFNFTLRHKVKKQSLYCCSTNQSAGEGSSIMSRTLTLKWVWNVFFPI
jgi:hypothetical protein